LAIRGLDQSASLGFVPQAVGRSDGQHHGDKSQMAVHARLGFLREPARQPPGLFATTEQAVLDPTAVVVAVDHRARVRDGGVGQADAVVCLSTESGARLTPQVDDHSLQDRALFPLLSRCPAVGHRPKVAPLAQIDSTMRTRKNQTSMCAARPCPRRTVSLRS